MRERQVDWDGDGSAPTRADARIALRFFPVDDDWNGNGRGAWPSRPPADSRLAASRAALRDAQQAEWDERQRQGRARVDGLTPTHAALLQARQAQTQAAQIAVEELRRRAVWLRHAIALGEEALATQRQLIEKLRRELAELGD
jgi:hypothetical protein